MARKLRSLEAEPRRGLTTTTHCWVLDSTPRSRLGGCRTTRHEFDVTLVIFVRKKSLLPAVAALGYMMGQTRCDDTCQSSHNGTAAIRLELGNNCVWCPRNSMLFTTK